MQGQKLRICQLCLKPETHPILELPSPQAERPDLLVIAGEHSGDEHAARMVAELLKEKPGTQVAALGGDISKLLVPSCYTTSQPAP